MAIDAEKKPRGGDRVARSAVVDALLTALERVIETEGALPSVRALASRAGVAIGSIYYYFREREDLVSLLIQREEQRLSERLLEVLATTPITTPMADMNAIVSSLEQWRSERGWIARLPMRFLTDHSWVATIFRSAVKAGSVPLAEICRRHHIRPMTPAENLHLVGSVVGNLLAWALEMDGADDLQVLVKLVGAYLDALPRSETLSE